jgi:hypothetical protein
MLCGRDRIRAAATNPEKYQNKNDNDPSAITSL